MLADRYFPGTDPIGKRMHITYGQSIIYREIVGVVGNVHQAGAVAQVNPQMYEPFAQAPRPYMMMIIHTAVNPSALAKSAREQLYAVDASQPAANVRTVDEIVSDQISQRRLVTVLLVLFSSIALVLAGIGTYGLLTILASQRRRELGVRIALGASRAEVFGLMIQGGLRLVLIGAVLGLAGSMLVPRIMSSLLFGVGALDLLTFIIATLLLLLVAFVACCVPAWRASKVDPVVILQQI
jgi:putative ABC transport system permease protein